MSDVATAIMDAAEKHMRIGGFGAFSFRDLAAEVGVKSSSVHYHFPTKEKLAAAVIARYTERVSVLLDEMLSKEVDPVKVAAQAFGYPVHSEDRLCPCLVLGAGIFDLPPEVSEKVQDYYRMWFAKLAAQGMSQQDASMLLSSLLGAQLLAAVQNGAETFDAVAREIVQGGKAIAA